MKFREPPVLMFLSDSNSNFTDKKQLQQVCVTKLMSVTKKIVKYVYRITAHWEKSQQGTNFQIKMVYYSLPKGKSEREA